MGAQTVEVNYTVWIWQNQFLALWQQGNNPTFLCFNVYLLKMDLIFEMTWYCHWTKMVYKIPWRAWCIENTVRCLVLFYLLQIYAIKNMFSKKNEEKFENLKNTKVKEKNQQTRSFSNWRRIQMLEKWNREEHIAGYS